MGAEVTGKLTLDTAQFRRAVDSAQSGWGRFSDNVEKGSGKLASAMAPAVKTATAMGAAIVAAGGAGAFALGGILSQGIALNSQMEQAGITFKAFTKDAKVAEEIVAALKKEADITPFDTTDMVQAGQALISSAKGSRDELMKLIKTAEILAALNPAQGLAGAAFSLREAEGGDYQSLIERFNISRGLVKQLKAEGKEGNELVLAALKNMGAGPELVAGLAGSFQGLQSTAAAFFDQIKAEVAQPTFEVLQAGMVEFSKAISGEEGQNVMEWAKEIGKDLGEAAKAVKEAIAGIDWDMVMEKAGQFANFLGTAATKAAEAANWLSNNAGAVNETTMATGNALMNPVRRAGASFLETRAAVADFMGMDESAANLRAGAEGLRNTAYEREQALAKVRRETEDKGNAEAAAKVSQKDILKNWLKANGKSVEDWTADKAIQGAVARVFGGTEEGMAAIRELGGDHVWANAKNYLSPGNLYQQNFQQNLQQQPAGTFNVNFNELYPKHSVMVTTGA